MGISEDQLASLGKEAEEAKSPPVVKKIEVKTVVSRVEPEKTAKSTPAINCGRPHRSEIVKNEKKEVETEIIEHAKKQPEDDSKR